MDVSDASLRFEPFCKRDSGRDFPVYCNSVRPSTVMNPEAARRLQNEYNEEVKKFNDLAALVKKLSAPRSQYLAQLSENELVISVCIAI